ncbi:hypothetical protein NDU88_008859 [Pleurodeles waltl]|uniref:Phospholipase A2 n=1 Tax=Pleurodeles waltl TaxID=8319 RepID=A0AAV7QR65_PLEWA|nr:hypothetical protein NDU88_008859 [Pleurodeles waltl]
MQSSLLSVLLISCLCHVTNGNLANFGFMMLDVTGKTSFPYYTSYGCHCGKGGAGMPVDATDWCCWTHDCCYEKLGLEGCSPKTEYYRYQVYKGIVVCGEYVHLLVLL